ncbi:MAG: putative Na+/H+ antiporter [Nitrosomonas sp.]
MNDPTSIQYIAAALFALAVIHTFSTKYFEHLAHIQPRHAGVWHLLGEVEVVFGLWAMILILVIFAFSGQHDAIEYLESRDFTEPMFVFVIMVIAGTRPILKFVASTVQRVATIVPLNQSMVMYFLLLSLVPLLGSFITEPAAMTLAALMLRDTLFSKDISTRLKYATVGVLFVNVSIGGTLTPFAAPPVLMVAAKWNWDITFMLINFGWKSALAVTLNALAVTWLFRREFDSMTVLKNSMDSASEAEKIPIIVVLIHLFFLLLVVLFAHHAVVFMGLFLFFLGYTAAYERHQSPLILREALLVAFFLAGLVVLGGQQQWWLQPVLMNMSETAVYFGATALTAVTDNAALTYLGSLVEGLTEEFKIALVAGAVTGGGLTVIANAPNPAGFSILKSKFDEQSIHPLGLLIAALPPTFVAIIAFRVL